jgi:hypothetical protein
VHAPRTRNVHVLSPPDAPPDLTLTSHLPLSLITISKHFQVLRAVRSQPCIFDISRSLSKHGTTYTSFATPTHSRHLAAPAAARYCRQHIVHPSPNANQKISPLPKYQSGTAPPLPPLPNRRHRTPYSFHSENSPFVLTTSRACKKQVSGPMVLRSTFHPLKCLDTKLGVSVFVDGYF